MMYKIFLSPSQQGNNRYAVGDTTEQEQCNKIAERAKEYIENWNMDIEVCVPPYGTPMNKAISMSNIWGSDIHIAIHTNAHDGKASGTLVMVYNNEKENMRLGEALFDEVSRTCQGKTKYGVRVNSTLAELNSTKAVAGYVECDFHDNPKQAEFIIKHTDDIGKAIAKAVYKYLGLEIKEETLYRVQLGAFKERKNAQALAEKLELLGYETYIV